MFLSVSLSGGGFSSLATSISNLETIGAADVSALPTNETCLLSVAHPFLYLETQGNETDKKLSPGSAGRILANKVSELAPSACLTLALLADSYETLNTELANLYSILPLPEVLQLMGMCEFMAGIENNKKLTNKAGSWPLHKKVNGFSVSDLGVLTGVKDLVENFNGDSEAELTAFETEVNERLAELKSALTDVSAITATLNNTKGILLQGSNQPQALQDAFEKLPQETPYCVSLCFSGEVEALEIYKELLGL